MTAFLVTLWMTAAAIGGGLAVLRLTGLLDVLSLSERLAVSFVIGTGGIGWLVFIPGAAGAFGNQAFAVILAVLSGGLMFLRTNGNKTPVPAPVSGIEWALVLGIGLALLMDVCEGLSPPADADTMAYHFETPRRFLAEGTLYAIPRALVGVTQLLLHMSYGVALGLGGVVAATLWVMVSGWSLGALFYVLARRHVTRPWALAGTLCLLTTPAIIYAAGTGQAEVRTAAFALLSAYAVAMSVRHSEYRRRSLAWALLAGIAAGFFAGSKMTGLIFCFAACMAMIGRGPGALCRIGAFCAAVIVTGTQWYVFNGLETGDPLYPMLWQHLELKPGYPWNAAVAEFMAESWFAENIASRSFEWYVMYPFRTIVAPLRPFESTLTGLGPAVLLLLPFSLAAVVGDPRRLASPLSRLLMIAWVFYTIWFFFGPSLRVRHLLPVYPLLLLCVLAGAAHYTANKALTKRVLTAGVAALLCIQLAGQMVFTKKYAAYLFTDTTADNFLERNISGFSVVRWLNTHLTRNDRVLVTTREWLFYLNVPYFMGHPAYQTQIALHKDARDFPTFVRQLAAQGITHIASAVEIPDEGASVLSRFIDKMTLRGCATQRARIDSQAIRSRTLPDAQPSPIVFAVYKIEPNRCS